MPFCRIKVRESMMAKVIAGTATEREERIYWKMEARVFRRWPGIVAFSR